MAEDEPRESVEEVEVAAYAWLRSHLAGFLRFDGERVALKVAPLPDGYLVAPVMVAMGMAADTVLELPDDGDDDLHLMVSLERFNEREDTNGWSDRWRAYHGDPPDVNWARIVIDASKFRGYFIDGDVYIRPNPLAAMESAICRKINSSLRDSVKSAIFAQLATDCLEPTVVGVDPLGFDVRRQFDVLRLCAPEGQPIRDEASAIACLEALTR